MDNTMYVGLSRQMILRRELDVVANNIANADTVGFKVESLMSRVEPRRLVGDSPVAQPVKFALDSGVARDFGQGTLQRTSAPLDVAIEGQGFFKVRTPAGERYTRDGRFSTDSTGRLVTKAGQPVLDDSGSEIVLDPEKGEPTISRDGVISQGILRVGKLGAYRFDSLSALEKTGDGLFRNTSNQQPQAATAALLHQGMTEASNVQPIQEITRMIEVTRAYESVSNMMDQTAQLDRKSIQRLGQVN